MNESTRVRDAGSRRRRTPPAVSAGPVAERQRRRAAAAAEQHLSVRDRWTVALIVVVWAWVCVPNIIQTVLSPKYRVGIGVESPPYSQLAALADYGLYLAVIGVCTLIILGFLRQANHSGIGLLLLMLLPWLYIVLRDVYAGMSFTHEGVTYPLIVLAVWMLQPDLRRLEVLGYLTGLTAVISILIALVMPTHGIFRTALGEVILEDKQILPGGILVGIFTQGNNLGQFLSLGLPTILLIRRGWVRWVVLAVSLLAVVWSASRGSLTAVAIGVVAYLVIRIARPAARWLFGPLLVVAVFTVVSVIPLTTTDPSAFTNRGLVWTESLEAWAANPWLGQGSQWYHEIGNTSSRIAGTVFHGHNQLVQFLVTGGIVFALLVVPQLIVATARATRFAVDGDYFGITWLAVLGGTCLFEKSFAFVDNGNYLAATVIPFAFLVFAQWQRPAAAEAPPPVAPAGRRRQLSRS